MASRPTENVEEMMEIVVCVVSVNTLTGAVHAYDGDVCIDGSAGFFDNMAHHYGGNEGSHRFMCFK